MHPYVIIGTPTCSYCSQAKALLLDKYSDYEYYDLEKNPWIKQLFKMSGLKTVPQVFSPEGNLIGGYEDLNVCLDEVAKPKVPTYGRGDRFMSSQETNFNYKKIIWTCQLLPYRIIACRDAIQYIVQVRNEKAYRSLSYFSEWEPIERHYPQLAMAGLPLNSPEVLSHEVKRRVMRLGHTAADRAAISPLFAT